MSQLTTPEPIAFTPFPKMARLSRECIVTEKIDGTNAQIFINPVDINRGIPAHSLGTLFAGGGLHYMAAGSRTRWITPQQDNHGFAAWAVHNFMQLQQLGPGRHFGEWWGSGIQRGYGLQKGEKRFSLFNTSRWCLHGHEPQQIPSADPRVVKTQDILPPCCHLVPVLRQGLFSTVLYELALNTLREHGSRAAPGFMRPEGIICYHVAAGVGFKKTIEHDESPKTLP